MRPTDILLKQPGLFARALGFLNPKNRFLVGYDLDGNRFLERPSSEPGARTKRTVEYTGKFEHISDAINRNRNLAVQWKAWLSHTRAEAPTIQELENDMRRRQELIYSVQAIQMREEADIARMEEARRQTLSSLPTPSATTTTTTTAAASIASPHLDTHVEPSLATSPESTAQNLASGAPHARGPGESSIPLDPTPETDPLRLESQRALQQQEQEAAAAAAAAGQTKPEGLVAGAGRERPVGGARPEGDWKPEGWSPSVSRRRG